MKFELFLDASGETQIILDIPLIVEALAPVEFGSLLSTEPTILLFFVSDMITSPVSGNANLDVTPLGVCGDLSMENIPPPGVFVTDEIPRLGENKK